MQVILVLLAAAVILGLAGRVYSGLLARSVGEDVSRITPAVAKSDGRDYVPTPTWVVFAHHFASIAGAGPIVGPVIAVIYGWVPALLWVLFGGLFIGAVHDYLATYMATREGGQSMATIVRRMIGVDAFVAIMLFMVLMLALVCATFLNLSAQALTSMLPFDRLELPTSQTLFRVQDNKVVIGGIASMSVIVITAVAPLMGWMYIKRKVSVYVCSLVALAVCAVSVIAGLYRPVALPAYVGPFSGQQIWMFLLSAYVLVAAGVPVWMFLQSRDFINVHLLYVGMAALLLTLLVAGARGAGSSEPLPAWNIGEGTSSQGFIWPSLFILIACGAVSGFHSLCAGGTTCKQLTSERAARQIGFNGMLLESFLAVCVIGVLMVGAVKSGYLADVHPNLINLKVQANAVQGFAMAVGNAGKLAFGLPIAAGALAGMVLLEGFIITTLDTAVRLTRYLIEEIWRVLFARYDVFAEPVSSQAAAEWTGEEPVPAGADGIPLAPPASENPPAPAHPVATSGAFRSLLTVLRRYWVNSGLAVALMLVFAFSGGQRALWEIFATANQLLAAMVLALASLWLARRGRTYVYAIVPAAFMMLTTIASLLLLLGKFARAVVTSWPQGLALLIADIVILIITSYLFVAAWRAIRLAMRQRGAGQSGQ